MKRAFLLIAVLLLAGTSLGHARVKVVGRGYQMNFDPDSLPAHLRGSFELMSRKCVLCHTMERTVIAIQTGRAPITGQPFDRQAVRAYGIKMLRKPNSDMSKQEIRDIVNLLSHLLEENSR